jgi:hypothetical protein
MHAKWMTTETLYRKFPLLLVEASTLLDINREELGHHEGFPPSLENH